MNKEAIVTLENGDEVVVKKLPLRKYADIFSALQELPKKIDLENIDTQSNEEFFNKLPTIIASCLPEVAKVISVATDVPEDKVLDELDLGEVVDLVVAILEVNNIEKVVASIKKLMARKPLTPAPASPAAK